MHVFLTLLFPTVESAWIVIFPCGGSLMHGAILQLISPREFITSNRSSPPFLQHTSCLQSRATQPFVYIPNADIQVLVTLANPNLQSCEQMECMNGPVPAIT